MTEGATREIIVGYDGTQPSGEAVLWAAHEASVRRASLQIISCYEIPTAGEAMFGWPSTQAVGELVEATEQNLHEIRDIVVRTHPDVHLKTITSAGPASIALLDDLTTRDLLVVGASSHHGKAAFWLGSTPRAVIRHSPCPVVVVRGAASRGRPDRIVVGIDGSRPSEQALRWATEEACLHQVPLVVIHGWWYPYVLAEDSRSQARDLTQVDAACVLDRAVELARELCPGDVTGQLVETGPASALLDAVRDGDLLVVGSRGHGAIMAGLIGSTVNSVVERSAVPVVVVRAQ
ncbi:MAG: universal stress protein [Ilumatobacteraceae bacterium]